ncbi:MAG TPA: hypothetical protein VGC29_01655 [Flavisolibacter sp.]
MKRTILAMLLVGSGCAVFAQDDSLRMSTTSDNTAMTTSTEYNAYGAFTATAPDYVSSYVVRDYPAASDVKWRQAGEWWHGYYIENGQPNHVYYNNAGQTFRVAIPVRQSLVSEDVVTKIVDLYGPMVYDVNTIKGTNGQEIYHVRLLDNGQIVHQYLNADGTKAIDIWRTDVADPELHSGMNVNSAGTTEVETESNIKEMKIKRDGDELKIKTEYKDGTETKTKIKDGKVKTKKDD